MAIYHWSPLLEQKGVCDSDFFELSDPPLPYELNEMHSHARKFNGCPSITPIIMLMRHITEIYLVWYQPSQPFLGRESRNLLSEYPPSKAMHMLIC